MHFCMSEAYASENHDDHYSHTEDFLHLLYYHSRHVFHSVRLNLTYLILVRHFLFQQSANYKRDKVTRRDWSKDNLFYIGQLIVLVIYYQ